MKKFIILTLSIFIIVATSVCAFAVTIYVSSTDEIPYFYNTVNGNSINVMSKADVTARYRELVTRGWPVSYQRVSTDGGSYTAIVLTDYASVYIKSGDDYVNYGGYNAGYYAGNSYGAYAYDNNEGSTGDDYTVVAIAGVSNYYLTNRPAGTTGNGYLGDLYLTYDNWLSIQSTLNNLTGDKSYYTYGHSINGEFRYYLANRPSTTTYYVCNSAGQLFYTIKDTGSSEDTGGGDSTFDPTEVITAINSVYDAINSQGSRLANGLSQLTITANTISDILNLHMNNVVDGFGDIQNSLSTLNSYFTDLSGLFPVQETITLLGSDTRVAWDSADRITNVTTSGFNGDLIVKERPGDLVDESGYEKVTINETEYSLYNDNNGYRRIKAANEYPDTSGVGVPDGTLFYFPFDDSYSSVVGDFELEYDGVPSYSSGINGDAFVYDGSHYLYSNDLGQLLSFSNRSFTLSYWIYLNEYPSTNGSVYSFVFGDGTGFQCNMNYAGKMEYAYIVDGNVTGGRTGDPYPLNTWVNISVTSDGSNIYTFCNGVLQMTFSYSIDSLRGSFYIGGMTGQPILSTGCKIDEFILVGGRALWTSSYEPSTNAIFSYVVQDYFLPCTDQDITLNFYDSTGEQVTEYRWNQYVVNTSRLPDGFTECEFIESTGTQCVDTGYRFTSNNVRLILDLVNTNTSNSTALCGAENGSATGSQGVASLILFSPSTSTADTFRLEHGSGNTGLNLTFPVNAKSHLDLSAYNGSVSALLNGNNYSVSYTGNTERLYTFTLFADNSQGDYILFSKYRLYSCQIYDNGTLVRDFVPCKNPSNVVGLYDLVNSQFYGNSGTGSFTAGNEVSNGSGIGQLVGVVSSTNANAYPDGGEQDGFYYEYIGAFTEYPSFSQTLSPTDVNGNAITMGRLEDDFSEIYMDISTMMWYCHDPQTQTEILLSSANQQIMNDTIYVRQNYTMLPADQITADALQNLLPVDSPVYLDMPEGAKLTITYDHYTGWFRMMYILMDKQTKLLSDLDIVNETIINVENTVIDITNNNPAYNVFYITKTDGTTESVGDAAKDAAVFVGDILSMFYRLVFDDALDNTDIIKDFEDTLTSTNSGVNVW